MPTDPNQPTTPSPQEQEGKLLTAEKIEAWRIGAVMEPDKPPRANPDGPYAIGYWLSAGEIDEAVAMLRAGLAAQWTNEALRRERDEARAALARREATNEESDFWQQRWKESHRAHLYWRGKECELVKLIEWALGQGDSDFPPRPEGAPLYWWRGELRRRLNEIVNDDGLVRQAPPTEGALRAAAQEAADWIDRNRCMHEETHRGGALWTICDSCGKKWADDRGGFQPEPDLPFLDVIRSALAAKEPAGEAPKASPTTKMQPVLYWLDDGKFARAMLTATDIGGIGYLVVDLTTGDGPSVIGKADWFESGYVAVYGGLVPECAHEGTAPGQWSYGVAKLPESSDARERGLMGRLREWAAACECDNSIDEQKRNNPSPAWSAGAAYAYANIRLEIDRLLAEAPREDAKAGALVEEVTEKLSAVGVHNATHDGQPIVSNINEDLRELRDAVLAVARAVDSVATSSASAPATPPADS